MIDVINSQLGTLSNGMRNFFTELSLQAVYSPVKF